MGAVTNILLAVKAQTPDAIKPSGSANLCLIVLGLGAGWLTGVHKELSAGRVAVLMLYGGLTGHLIYKGTTITRRFVISKTTTPERPDLQFVEAFIASHGINELQMQAAEMAPFTKALAGSLQPAWETLRITGGEVTDLKMVRVLIKSFPDLKKVIFENCTVHLQPDGSRRAVHSQVHYLSFAGCKFSSRLPVGHFREWFPKLNCLVVPHVDGQGFLLGPDGLSAAKKVHHVRIHSCGYLISASYAAYFRIENCPYCRQRWQWEKLLPFEPRAVRYRWHEGHWMTELLDTSDLPVREGETLLYHEACGALLPAGSDRALCCAEEGSPLRPVIVAWERAEPEARPRSLEELERKLFGPLLTDPALLQESPPPLPILEISSDNAGSVRAEVTGRTAVFELRIRRFSCDQITSELNGETYPLVESLVLNRLGRESLADLRSLLKLFPNLAKLVLNDCTVDLDCLTEEGLIHERVYFVSFAGSQFTPSLAASHLDQLDRAFPALHYLVLPHDKGRQFLLGPDPASGKYESRVCRQPCGHLIGSKAAESRSKQDLWECPQCNIPWSEEGCLGHEFEPRAIGYVKRREGWAAKVFDPQDRLVQGKAFYHPPCKAVIKKERLAAPCPCNSQWDDRLLQPVVIDWTPKPSTTLPQSLATLGAMFFAPNS
jgi:hypothetical protein